MTQLELPFGVMLPPEDKNAQLEYLCNSVKESNRRVTRRLWVENNKLKQVCKELQERLEILERNICNS